VGVPADPFGAAKKVLAVWLAKLEGRTASVPPKVKLPLVVTVPERLNPLTVPVPPTLVTVPVVLDVPAPIAVRNDAASSEDIVLSALNLGNAIAATFASVNRFPPRVVAPKLVRAAEFVVAPVPPLATATVPVTFAAVPVVFWFRVGISAATIARNVGTPADPLGAASTVFAVWLEKLEGKTASVPPKVIVPVVVIVPPVRVSPLTVPDVATDVTVPVVLEVPAPIAVRNAAASSDDTVLSALNRGKAIAATFAIVNRFAPSVVAPRLVLATPVVVAPVPPLATATVPVTFAAVPVVF
jgi:hypothetical protein